MNRDLVVIGASAGGVEALRAVVSRLPRDLPATVLVVLHLPEGGHSALPAILTRAGPLLARHPADGQPLTPGEIFVAPPDHHLTVVDGVVRLTHGPRENGHRPAVDPLFRSAARWLGPRVIGVVLSGTLDDGTAGQAAIAREGGVTVVQDPLDALYPGMPTNVLEHLVVDHVAPAAALGPLLNRLVRGEAESVQADPPGPGPTFPVEPSSDTVGLGCPNCGGSLYPVEDAALVRYRCRVGHAWSPESLLAEQSEALETALWMALRTLDDRAALCRRAESEAAQRTQDRVAARFRSEAGEAERSARVLREALERAQHATRSAVIAIDDTSDECGGVG